MFVYLTSIEKKKLSKCSLENRDAFLLKLFEKYSIKEKLFDDISNVTNNIHTNINSISPQYVNLVWV